MKFLMISLWNDSLKIIKSEGMLRFLRKMVFFIVGQLVCLFLYPLFLAMNIRFVPVNSSHIGHLASELECYIKEGFLGLRPPYRSIVLISRKKVANPHLLSYWKKYVCVIDNSVLFSLLWGSLRRKNLISYNVGKYFSDWKYFYGTSERVCYAEIQKQYYGNPPILSLTDFDRKRGWEELRKIGIPENAWFACVHCRESGYGDERSRDAVALRDVNVGNYFLAIQEIVDRGGWIIRVGDPTMKPIPKIKNVIDYAHLDMKSDWMDVFLCASCKFFLGSNSGLASLATVFGVPSVVPNIAGPFSGVLPYGPQDIGIPKLFWSLEEKRYLSFKEILSSPIGNFSWDYLFASYNIQAVENSPEDIREVAIEMLDRLEGKLQYSQDDECIQAQFKSLMNPTHFSYGAISRVGKSFLKKYEYLL